MDYHQNARLTIHSREQLAQIVVERGGTLKAAAAAFNVSAKTAAKWVGRFREHGVSGLRDRSSRPKRSPRSTSSSLLERVLLFIGKGFGSSPAALEWLAHRQRAEPQPSHHSLRTTADWLQRL